jgi:hypothetical protein
MYSETEAFLPPFLDLLRSDLPITIPKETLHGAISHFMYTLPASRLPSFVRALVASPRLWDDAGGVREAIQLSFQAKVARLSERDGEWLGGRRKRRDVMTWASGILNEVVSARSVLGRVHALAGIVRGMASTDVHWGAVKAKAEEELVLDLASMLERPAQQALALQLFCEVAYCIEEDRLSALDLEVSYCYLSARGLD